MDEQELEQRKAAVIADNGRFQSACGKLVERGVLHCASSMMYNVGQNLEAACEMFDIDYDEALGWFQHDDYNEPVVEFIRNDADLDQLEWIADNCGSWSDVLLELGYDGDTEDIDLEDWLKLPANDDKEDALCEAVIDLITNDDEYREVAQEYDIEPYTHEVYEHCVVDSWFAERLRESGEIVFDFCDFTIWGRCTTGQAILLDYVVQQIAKEQKAYSYIWEV